MNRRVLLTPLRRFVLGIGLVGLAVIAQSLAALPSTPHALAWMSVAALALVSGSFALKVPGVSANISISDTFYITAAVLFGPAPATLAIALDSFIISWKRRPTLDRLLFNTTSTALSLWGASQVFYAMVGTGPLFDQGLRPDASLIPPFAALGMAYYLLNSGLLATAVALDRGQSPFEVWRQHFTILSLNYLASASAAFVVIVLLKYVGPMAMTALVPVLITFYLAMRSWLGRLDDAERHVARVNRLYISTVTALSTAIEAKDGVTSDHIHRVQAYAMGLARALGISDPETLQAIEAAALLHDTGKIAIPEYILNKPGRLSAAEFETMKSHVDVGAEILSAIEFPYPVVPIVEAHHENWNGSGYPRGLRGEDIPIGARILSVVDCFDALTSDRPYRPALSQTDALAIVQERRGTFYDPRVVDAFVKVCPTIIVSTAPATALHSAIRGIRGVRHAAPTEAPAPGPTPLAAATDISDDLLAFVSLARVTARTPVLADIWALASIHLRQLAPGATVGFFVIDQARHAAVLAHACGQSAARLNGLAIALGERVTGWAAATGRVMTNADARLDLDGGGDPADPRFALALPLLGDRGVIAVVTLYAPDRFAVDVTRRLEMIAPHLATAVAGAQGVPSAASPTESQRTRSSRSDLHLVARR